MLFDVSYRYLVTYTLACPHCQSENVIKFGATGKGTQRFRCQDCNKTFCHNPTPRSLSAEKEALILAAYQERVSMRGIARTFHVSRNTVSKLLKKKSDTCLP